MGYLVALLLGAVIGWVAARRLRQPPALGSVPIFDDKTGPSAVDPGDPNLPDAVTTATDNATIERIPHEELRTLVRTLMTWQPKRHKKEDSFQRSFERHLSENGVPPARIERHPRLPWTAEDRDPNSQDKEAIPDFSVGSVLVEIKRNVFASAESDRILGQMARYCIAWRRKGPALLVVCNEYDDNLRRFVERTVRGWKAQGIPVMAYFARNPQVVAGDDEFPPGTFPP
jgi:hypothetical protein